LSDKGAGIVGGNIAAACEFKINGGRSRRQFAGADESEISSRVSWNQACFTNVCIPVVNFFFQLE
jgi:hypothetical protein